MEKHIEALVRRSYAGAMQHASGFLKLVNEARANIREITIPKARELLAANPQAVLLDVREESEWDKGHAKHAQHLGKGVLERDIEERFPDKSTEIIMYCGGGFRSALTCDAARRMGYSRVHSLEGGYRAIIAAEWPIES